MRYLGVDLAWSKNNFSALTILEDNILIQTVYLKSDDEILDYIIQIKPDKIGVDAPLEVLNTTGTRDIENSFLKDFAKYKLGVYPVNKNISSDKNIMLCKFKYDFLMLIWFLNCCNKKTYCT